MSPIVPFINLRAQHESVRAEIDRAFSTLLENCQFVLGSPVAEFEKEFAAFTGVRHAIGVGNGLDALRLSLQAIALAPGDEVILPANTYIATALAVSQAGGRPVFVDCEADTFNIAVSRIEAAITPRTRAIIPVHLTGQAANLDPILGIAQRHGLRVIEDAAQAHGTLYRGWPCGSLGAAGCFSFFPTKNLGACGDGGMVTTNDDELAGRLRRLRNYGQDVRYHHAEQGSNSRLDTLQAAILSIKLRRLAAWNVARAAHAANYRARLVGVGDLVFQSEVPWSNHVHYVFVIQTDRRDALQKHLAGEGVETIIHYPIPIHLQPAYAELGYRPGDFPVTERLAGRILSLPMFPELTEAQIDHVVRTVGRFFDA
jgi:dTDP-4-amino-4,6-dideoxygalactose transaminase